MNGHLNHQLIESCLCGELSDDQEAAIQHHLDGCTACRSQFDVAAGEPNDWQRISTALKIEQQAIRSSSSQSYDLHAAPYFPGDYAQAPIDFAISFLEPSNREGALGRLGEYEIHNVIGFGGMGIVLKGFQEELNRPVAVKVMAPHLATSAAARKRFLREAQATAAIVHPNVMPILSVSEKAALPFLVMPYVACHSLQQRLDAEGTLPLVEVLRIALQVAEGLAAAHSHGLVHRDVKPANILLERGVDRALLTDFGLARAVDDATLTRSGVIAGTPQYMSPEQARGDSVDARSDLFSLGSVIYAMCVGHPPFRAETSYGILRKVTDSEPRSMREQNGDVPAWLERLVEKLMSKQRDVRFTDASYVANLLRQCLAQVQHPMSQTIPQELAQPPVAKHSHAKPSVTWVAVLLLLPLLVVVAIGFTVWSASRQAAALSQQHAAIEAEQAAIESQFVEPVSPATHQDLQAEIDAIGLEVDRLLKSNEPSTGSPD